MSGRVKSKWVKCGQDRPKSGYGREKVRYAGEGKSRNVQKLFDAKAETERWTAPSEPCQLKLSPVKVP